MKRNYILIYDPENLNSILGVFTSGKKLADAVPNIDADLVDDCMVKIVPVDDLRNTEAGHDYQGTRLNEFLAAPISKDDTGA